MGQIVEKNGVNWRVVKNNGDVVDIEVTRGLGYNYEVKVGDDFGTYGFRGVYAFRNMEDIERWIGRK